MKFGKSLVLLMLVLFAFTAAPQASAEESAQPKGQWILLPVMKLSRGIANVAFSPLELPMKWWDTTNELGGIAGITYGTLKGVCYTIARVVVGVVDVATFIVPLPGCPNYPEDSGWGYGPIMKPAWIVPVSKDWNNFIYSNETIVNPATL